MKTCVKCQKQFRRLSENGLCAQCRDDEWNEIYWSKTTLKESMQERQNLRIDELPLVATEPCKDCPYREGCLRPCKAFDQYVDTGKWDEGLIAA